MPTWMVRCSKVDEKRGLVMSKLTVQSNFADSAVAAVAAVVAEQLQGSKNFGKEAVAC